MPWFENFLALLLQILLMAIFVRVLLTWLPIDQSNPIVRVLFDVTEPVLAPIRRRLPPMSGFDLSPMVVMLGAYLLISILRNIA